MGLATPADPDRTSGFNVRVAGIQKAPTGRQWAQFLTEPKDNGRGIRVTLRDQDGHLIDVGRATGLLTGDESTAEGSPGAPAE